MDCTTSEDAHNGVPFPQLDDARDDEENTLVIIAFAKQGFAAIDVDLVRAGRQLRQRFCRNGAEDLG